MKPTATHDVLVKTIYFHEIERHMEEGWTIEPNGGHHARYNVLACKKIPRKKKVPRKPLRRKG